MGKNTNGLRAHAALALAVLIGTAGCATGPTFQSVEAPPADQAQIYFYRTTQFFGGAMVHKVQVDAGEERQSLPNGGWVRVLVAPGTHTVNVEDYLGIMSCAPRPMTLTLKPGQTVYVENKVHMVSSNGPFTNLGCSVRMVAEPEAQKQLLSLRQSN